MKRVFPAALGAFTLTLALLFSGCQRLAPFEKQPPPLLILNQDNSSFFLYHTEAAMNQEGLEAFVDQYADTKVTHLFFCPNSMRVNYASAVWESIWEVDGLKAPPRNSLQERRLHNAKHLEEQRLDPYRIWIARCRQQGLSPWISVRMNDLEALSNPTHHTHSTFWREHPEYRRSPSGKGDWTAQLLDFRHHAVRTHALELLQELLSRYDPDGLELDWMRFPYHFSPGEEANGRPMLTGFMREVRNLAEQYARQRGHRIRIAVRVPTHPNAAFQLGMDTVTWVREGLVDMLTPAPFGESSDFTIDMMLWRAQLRPLPEDFILAAGFDATSRPWPGATPIKNDLAMARAFSANALQQGADGVYLFNYPTPHVLADGPKAYHDLLDQGLGRRVCLKGLRRYPVTYRDTRAPGLNSQVRLPALLHNKPRFTINSGPKAKGGAEIWIGLKEPVAGDAPPVKVLLNNTACAYRGQVMPAPSLPESACVLAFKAPAHALYDAVNTLQIQPGAKAEELTLTWVELRLLPDSRKTGF